MARLPAVFRRVCATFPNIREEYYVTPAKSGSYIVTATADQAGIQAGVEDRVLVRIEAAVASELIRQGAVSRELETQVAEDQPEGKSGLVLVCEHSAKPLGWLQADLEGDGIGDIFEDEATLIERMTPVTGISPFK